MFAADPLSDTEAPTPNRPRVKLVTVGELKRLPRPRWLVAGMVPEHALVETFGDSGHFKSFIALDMALSVATGTDYHGRKTEPGTVVCRWS